MATTVVTVLFFQVSANHLDLNMEMTILLQVHLKEEDENICLQLQFMSPESKTVNIQHLPKINTKNNITDIVEMTKNEEICARLTFSDIKKCLKITSGLKRNFELDRVLKSDKLGFEEFNHRIYIKKDIMCAVFKQNSYSYRLNMYANSSKPMKIMVKDMYQNVKDDVLITLEKQLIETKISKKFALMDEIEAIQNGRASKELKEITTDRAFLSL